MGRTLKNRRFCHPFAVGKSIQVSGTTIDLGARPDGIMPQGIKLLAFRFPLLGISFMHRHFTMESLILAQDER